MKSLLEEIRRCEICSTNLPLGPNPIVEASETSKILIVGQAPGLKVHHSGTAWDDASGKKLRNWLGVTEEQFYNLANFAIIPMGFCYPGKGKTGDLPPRPECAETWHEKLFASFKNPVLKLVIGTYANNYFFGNDKMNLTNRIKDYESYLPEYWPLPHPSPVNRFWRSKNPWFENEVVPELQKAIAGIIPQN